MTTDISILFKEFKLFWEEMITNSCLFGKPGCPDIRFPKLQRSIVFSELNGYRSLNTNRPDKKKKKSLHLNSKFPLVFVSFISDTKYIHHTALDVPLRKLSKRGYLYLPHNTIENSIPHLIAEICSSSCILQQIL